MTKLQITMTAPCVLLINCLITHRINNKVPKMPFY